MSDSSGFEFEHLFDVSDGFYAGQQHPLNGKPCVLADLVTFPKLSVSAFGNRHIGIVDRDELDPSFSRPRSSAANFVSTNSLFAGIDLLQETNAILTYPLASEDFFKTQRIERLDVTDLEPNLVPIGIYSLATKNVEDRVAGLKNALKKQISKRDPSSVV